MSITIEDLTETNENKHDVLESTEIPEVNVDDAPNEYYDNSFYWKSYKVDVDLSDLWKTWQVFVAYCLVWYFSQ